MKNQSERPRVIYEWVVELEDEHGDIRDCAYWDERERQRAAQNALHGADSLEWVHKINFGLCRRLIDPVDGDLDRTYAYADADGKLPAEFEDGRPIPQRFL